MTQTPIESPEQISNGLAAQQYICDATLGAALRDPSKALDVALLQQFLPQLNKTLSSSMVDHGMDPTDLQKGIANCQQWLQHAMRGPKLMMELHKAYGGDMDIILDTFTELTGYEMDEIPAGVLGLFSYVDDIEKEKVTTTLQAKHGSALSTMIKGDFLPDDDKALFEQAPEKAKEAFQAMIDDNPNILYDFDTQLKAMKRLSDALKLLGQDAPGKA